MIELILVGIVCFIAGGWFSSYLWIYLMKDYIVDSGFFKFKGIKYIVSLEEQAEVGMYTEQCLDQKIDDVLNPPGDE